MPKTGVLFIIGDWNAKVGNQEIPEITGKFGLVVQNESGQRLTVLPRDALVIANIFSNNTREDFTHGHHQMVSTEIRLIIFFAAEWRRCILSAKTRLGGVVLERRPQGAVSHEVQRRGQ